MKIKVGDLLVFTENEFQVLMFKDLKSDQYFLIRKETEENTPFEKYYIEKNDQKFSCDEGIMMIQLYLDQIIINIRLEDRAVIGASGIIIELDKIPLAQIEKTIDGFFKKPRFKIQNYLRIKKINNISFQVKSGRAVVDYSISNITDSEFKSLSDEIDLKDFENYEGVIKEFNVWKGNEVILHIAEKFNAVELKDHRAKYHPSCNESAPFLLDDGRVLLLTVVSASFFDSEEEYLKEVSSWRQFKNNE